jgi:hypothetical protein
LWFVVVVVEAVGEGAVVLWVLAKDDEDDSVCLFMTIE